MLSVFHVNRRTWRANIVIALGLLLGLLFISLYPHTVYASGFPIIGVLHVSNSSDPEGVAVDTSTHMVYIAYEYPGLVVGFDPVKGSVRWQAKVGDTVTDVEVDSQTHRVFVSSLLYGGGKGLLAILDGASGKTLYSVNTAVGDEGLVIDTKRGRVYVASSERGIIEVFTLATSPAGQLSARSSTLLIDPHPAALGINNRLGRLYVGDSNANTITVYDEDHGRILATIPVAADPLQPLRVDEATGRVYAVCSLGQELDVIDGNANKVIARVPVSPYPEGVAFNTATGRIYVADEGNKDTSLNDQNAGTTITVIDGQTFGVLGTLQVGQGPDGVEADPQLQRVYVTVESSDALVEISDSVDLPLVPDTNYRNMLEVNHAVSLLHQATIITLILMALAIAGAIWGAKSRQRQGSSEAASTSR